MSELLHYVPAGVGMTIVVFVATFLGLWRSIFVQKESNSAAIDSLRRQLEIQDNELERLRKELKRTEELLEALKKQK